MMVDRLLKSTPDGKLTVFKSGYSVDKMFGSVNCRFSRCKFLCFRRCEKEHRPAAVSICHRRQRRRGHRGPDTHNI